MYNLQSGLHRQRFPARLTAAQAKRLQAHIANGEDVGDGTQDKWARGLGKHTKAVTGIEVDNLNRTVISCSLDGTVKVSSSYCRTSPWSRANPHIVLGLHEWPITTPD